MLGSKRIALQENRLEVFATIGWFRLQGYNKASAVTVDVIDGDLLDFPMGINTIAHSCNIMNIMGAGIARQIKEKYPEAFKIDSKANLNQENGLGYFSYCKLDSDSNKRVINLYTQEATGSGRQVNYEAFYSSIEYLFQAINSSPDAAQYVLGLPFGISCGLAGGNWNIIQSMIGEVFTPAKFKTYIVKLSLNADA
jgi:O-acetyl-ADP-ribose deacetylase (regulator of RNase III)